MDTLRPDWIANPCSEARHQNGAAHSTASSAMAVELTPREREVLRYLTWRATDREIAESLSISPRTVMHHVSHVLDKLGAVNRRDPAVLAAHHDLN
jgi:DNA-binding NarL/FixJ family response regulator